MKCPICGKQTTWENNPTRPFCSERCQMIDLGNWASESYGVPVTSPAQGAEHLEDLPRTSETESRSGFS